jgi:hypothetical protein
VLGISGHLEFALLYATDSCFFHQPLDSLFAAVNALLAQLLVNAGTTIDPAALTIDLQYLLFDNLILYPVPANWSDQAAVICCPGHLQDPAHRLDTELARVLPYEPIDHFGILEKMAVAFYT